MAIFAVICIALFMAAVAIGLTLDAKRGPMPIGFVSMRECSEVGFTARWAEGLVDRQDPRHRTLMFIRLRLGRYPNAFFLRAMSRSELETVAPFIDEVIAGRGPPWNLPAEYEDERPAVLTEFKTRMQREGMWPKSVPLSP